MQQPSNVVRYRGKARGKGVSRRFWLPLFSFAAIALFAAYLASPLSLIEKVETVGNEYVSEEALSAAAGLAPGMHIWRIRLAASRDKLLQNPWLAKVRLDRVLPGTIKITVQERKAIAVLKGMEQNWVVARDGMVLEENKDFSLPWVTGTLDEQVEPGSVVSGQAVSLALEWLEILEPLESQVSEVNFDSFPIYVSVYTNDGYKVLFDAGADMDVRVLDLVALLKELRENRQNGTIDFRAGVGRGVFTPWPAEGGGQDN